jgi:hypothetical protein
MRNAQQCMCLLTTRSSGIRPGNRRPPSQQLPPRAPTPCHQDANALLYVATTRSVRSHGHGSWPVELCTHQSCSQPRLPGPHQPTPRRTYPAHLLSLRRTAYLIPALPTFRSKKSSTFLCNSSSSSAQVRSIHPHFHKQSRYTYTHSSV